MAAKRGRKSRASMEVTVSPAELLRTPRILPPERMDDQAREVWFDLVNACEASHFRDSDGPLLQRYCETIVAIPLSKDTDEFCKLTRLQIALSRALRLCPSSRIDPKTLGRQKERRAVAPWDFTGKPTGD
jgi:hypothetical protein